jgi:hypothetical protein
MKKEKHNLSILALILFMIFSISTYSQSEVGENFYEVKDHPFYSEYKHIENDEIELLFISDDLSEVMIYKDDKSDKVKYFVRCFHKGLPDWKIEEFLEKDNHFNLPNTNEWLPQERLSYSKVVFELWETDNELDEYLKCLWYVE